MSKKEQRESNFGDYIVMCTNPLLYHAMKYADDDNTPNMSNDVHTEVPNDEHSEVSVTKSVLLGLLIGVLGSLSLIFMSMI